MTEADTLIQRKIRWRDAATRYRMKEQYAIKLYDNDEESKDASFFGLRDDNNWILDDTSIDKACMRNHVVIDLWNDMATKPYYFDDESEAQTDTKGQHTPYKIPNSTLWTSTSQESKGMKNRLLPFHIFQTRIPNFKTRFLTRSGHSEYPIIYLRL